MNHICNVDIKRMLSANYLEWPEPGEAGDNDSALGGNREYYDLRKISWKEARRVYQQEGELIDRILAAADPEEEYLRINEEFEEKDEIYGLDVGVASAVVALSAARCIPFSSCNGGVFGGTHYEAHPVVGFFTRPEHITPLMDLAEYSDCGLVNGSYGCTVLYSDDIMKLRRFALRLSEKSTVFAKLKSGQRSLRSASKAKDKPGSLQLKLL